MSSATISVVMPAYNHAKFVKRSIESVLDQDVEELELVVIDDGSKDSTWDVIEHTRANSRRSFLALRQENVGVCKTLNRGIQLTSGSLVAVIASDDYFLPGKLRKQREVFAASGPDLALVHTSGYLDYQEGRQLEDMTGSYQPAVGRCFDQVLTQQVRIVAPSMMFRRQAYDRIGGFDESLGAEDVDFFLRLAAEGYEFAYIPEPLIGKTAVAGSGGSNLRKLIKVHEQILAKQRHRLTDERYEALRRLMYEHLVVLSAGAGEYQLAAETAINLAREQLSLRPLLALGAWSARAAFLRSLPLEVRHSLRLARARLRKLRGRPTSGARQGNDET